MQHEVEVNEATTTTVSGVLHPARRTPSRNAGFDWDGAMASTLDGDAAAYRALLAQSARWLRRFYARRLPAEVIDDVVQETLIAIHTKRSSFTPGRPYLPWLSTIARYKWVDVIRASKRHRTEELVEAAAESHEEDVVSELSVVTLLDRLRAGQAEVIRLVKLEGRSIKEAADLSGQSESLVKVNIHRGILAMRAMLGGDATATA